MVYIKFNIILRVEAPKLWAGIKGLKVLKTAQSGFSNFVRDEFCSLPDTKDRIFCTTIYAKWEYNTTTNFDFTDAWQVE